MKTRPGFCTAFTYSFLEESMFRLIKLAIYGLLGYALYEFVRGLTEGPEHAAGQPRGSASRQRSLDEDSGRQNMTGPSRGRKVTTNEPSGESVSHVVGRGVVSR
jgi:hypothetical protein